MDRYQTSDPWVSTFLSCHMGFIVLLGWPSLDPVLTGTLCTGFAPFWLPLLFVLMQVPRENLSKDKFCHVTCWDCLLLSYEMHLTSSIGWRRFTYWLSKTHKEITLTADVNILGLLSFVFFSFKIRYLNLFFDFEIWNLNMVPKRLPLLHMTGVIWFCFAFLVYGVWITRKHNYECPLVGHCSIPIKFLEVIFVD